MSIILICVTLQRCNLEIARGEVRAKVIDAISSSAGEDKHEATDEMCVVAQGDADIIAG
jgi:hypothetical protein